MAKNDITGDNIQSKASNQKFRDNWDQIFGKKNEQITEVSKDDGLHGQDARDMQFQSRNDSSSSS